MLRITLSEEELHLLAQVLAEYSKKNPGLPEMKLRKLEAKESVANQDNTQKQSHIGLDDDDSYIVELSSARSETFSGQSQIIHDRAPPPHKRMRFSSAPPVLRPFTDMDNDETHFALVEGNLTPDPELVTQAISEYNQDQAVGQKRRRKDDEEGSSQANSDN